MRPIQMPFAVIALFIGGVMAPSEMMTVAHAAGDAGHGGEYSIWADLAFWSVLAFIGVIIAVKKLGLWALLKNSMAAREDQERKIIQAAEGVRSEALVALNASKAQIQSLGTKTQEIFAEAQRDVESTKRDILALANKEADSVLQRAKVEIDRLRDQTLNEIFANLADKVTTQAEARLRSGLTAEDQNRLIQEALSQSNVS